MNLCFLDKGCQLRRQQCHCLWLVRATVDANELRQPMGR